MLSLLSCYSYSSIDSSDRYDWHSKPVAGHLSTRTLQNSTTFGNNQSTETGGQELSTVTINSVR